MTTPDRLNDDDLRQLERALDSGALRDDERLERWVGSLLAEVKHHRRQHHAGDPTDAEEAAPRKSHGDALLDQSGSRQGDREG
jgi:hypothetical protein